jgi:protein phosphatase methylesterase 1
VAIRLCKDPRLSGMAECAGLVVVDMVEGSALASIDHMRETLGRMPRGFGSVEQAIQWTLSAGIVKNLESCKISVPAQLVPVRATETRRPLELSRPPLALLLQVEGGLAWRTDLVKSAPFWRDWFTGLSEAFLSATCPKLLALASWDRIDTTLMKGQLQGKFEVQIIHGSHHACHEDFPQEFARMIFRFLVRNGILSADDEDLEAALRSKLSKARTEFRPSSGSTDGVP